MTVPKRTGLESFEPVLAILAQLKMSGDLFIALSPPFDVSFEIDRAVLRRRITGGGLSDSTFRHTAARIGPMLLAVLEDDIEDFVHRRVYHDDREQQAPLEGGSGQDESRLLTMVEQVKTTLHDTHLQARYDLKKSSKAPSFTGIDWDIKMKLEDGSMETLTQFPYATCKIRYQREFELNPWSILSGRGFEAVQINVSIDEVKHLLRVFRTIKERLDAAEDKNAP